MVKKCKKCRVPLEGVRYRIIAKPLFGIKPGKNGCCNKCESSLKKTSVKRSNKLNKKRRNKK